MRVLTVNAGSSTLKLRLLDGETLVADRSIETSDGRAAGGRAARRPVGAGVVVGGEAAGEEAAGHGAVGEGSLGGRASGRSPGEGAVPEGAVGSGSADERAVREILRDMPRPDAVGHRVVHGGGVFSSAVRLDPDVRARLEEFVPLAPLHQPAALDGIDLLAKVLPDVPAVACFDTTFHATLPPGAATYAVPEEWRSRYGVRRFGFHGLSHAYASRRAAQMLGREDPEFRLVICHLGAGASLSAVRGGTCVDTTMGFTPLEGLVMATRSGDVDPGLLLWLATDQGLAVSELADALQHRSGLRGLAGTSDMRAVLRRVERGDPRAELALDVYLHRLRSGISAMAASAGGVDALVFTGGVGEHAALVRARAVCGLEFLGAAIDAQANARAEGDTEVTAAGARCRSLVVAAREDLQIADEVRRLLQGRPTSSP